MATINNDTRIEGLGKGRKQNVKCPSTADDLTLTLIGSPSVCLAFEIIEIFSEATGLKLNIEKTQGMMVGSSCTDNLLPSINWQNQSIKILGFQIGNVNPRTIWHDSLEAENAYKRALPDLASQIVTGKIQTSSTNYLQCTYLSFGHDLTKTNRNRIFKLLD